MCARKASPGQPPRPPQAAAGEPPARIAREPSPAIDGGARPLRGLTVLNPREAGSAGGLTARLEALGARVIERPLLAFAPPLSWEPFDRRLAALAPRDWVAFTSATAVRHALDRVRVLDHGIERLAAARIAAVGAATARALREAGLPVALVPEHFQGEGLLAALLEHLRPGDRLWLPRAEQAREVLVEGLRAAGVAVEVTAVYRTVPPEGGLGPALEALEQGRLDWVLFTSSSTLTHFLRLLPDRARPGRLPRWPRIACLGRVVAEAARRAGLDVAVVPERQDLDGLLDALVAYVTGGATSPTPARPRP